jgi:hypothetical protein
MSQFDDLLDEVLHEDGNQHPPAGFHDRLLAALPSGAGRASSVTAVWVKVAAVLVLGVVGLAAWKLFTIRDSHQVATGSTPGGFKRPPISPSVNGVGLQEPHADQFAGRNSSFHKSIRRALPLRPRSIQIPPVVIAPLAIKPINIAAISPDVPARKGTLK